jgi:hypothetical protein
MTKKQIRLLDDIYDIVHGSVSRVINDSLEVIKNHHIDPSPYFESWLSMRDGIAVGIDTIARRMLWDEMNIHYYFSGHGLFYFKSWPI